MADDRRSTPMTSESELPLVLRLADFQRLLCCSERTVERLYKAHQLPAPLIEGKRTRPRWSRDDVVAWLRGASPKRGRRA